MWSKPKRNLERKRLPFAFKMISFLHNMQSTTRYVTTLTCYIVIMATREMLFKGSVKFLKDIKRATRVISQSFKGHEEVAALDFLLIKCHNVKLLLLLLLTLSSQDEIHEYQDEIDAELQNSRPKLRGVYAAYAKEGTEQMEKCPTMLCAWVTLNIYEHTSMRISVHMLICRCAKCSVSLNYCLCCDPARGYEESEKQFI